MRFFGKNSPKLAPQRDGLCNVGVYGHTPKVVWVRLGNCSTDQVTQMLRRHAQHLAVFEADAEAAFLGLS